MKPKGHFNVNQSIINQSLKKDTNKNSTLSIDLNTNNIFIKKYHYSIINFNQLFLYIFFNLKVIILILLNSPLKFYLKRN